MQFNFDGVFTGRGCVCFLDIDDRRYVDPDPFVLDFYVPFFMRVGADPPKLRDMHDSPLFHYARDLMRAFEAVLVFLCLGVLL